MSDDEFNFGSQIVPRADWEKVAGSFVPKLPHPANVVVIGYPHNNYTRSLAGPLGFIDRLNTMQYVDMKKYPDIKYNFVIGDDGKVYEARGWKYVPSLPLKYKSLSFHSYYIALVGEFERDPPGEEFFGLTNNLIRYGVELGYISKKHMVLSLRSNVCSDLHSYDYCEGKVTSSLF